MPNVQHLIESRNTAKWIIAERILRLKEINLLCRFDAAIDAAASPYRIKRIESRLNRVRDMQEWIAENWGCLHGDSAAECAAYSDYLVCKGEYESRTCERWIDD